MRILFLITVFFKLSLSSEDFFKNVICGETILEHYDSDFKNELCVFDKIQSSNEIEKIMSELNAGYQFSYHECEYISYSSQCYEKRRNWEDYTEIALWNSNITRISFNDYGLMANKKSFIATNVGLKELNRDDLKPLKSIELLDISNNNLVYLGNMLFRFPQQLKHLNISTNKIESIHVGAFDECSPLLIEINLSFNKLKQFPSNIIDAVSSKSLSLHLQHNQIEEMSTPLVNKNFTLSELDISNNLLRNFTLSCNKINVLWLNDNKLNNFATPKCKIIHLYISNNEFNELNITQVSSLFLSPNIHLKKLVMSDVSELTYLDAHDLNVNVVTMDMLKNASRLEYLDLSGTFIGSLSYDTFAEMTSLYVLKLKNTGITKIDYGMLAHQKNLTELDISFNNLLTIDSHVFSNLKFLEKLDVSGNNLTEISHIEYISKLKFIGIDQNDFNCTYLGKVIKFLNDKNIFILEPDDPIKLSANINGISCKSSSQIMLKILPVSKDEISNKLNEVIEQLNAEKIKNSNEKLDFDIIRSQFFHIRNEIIELKTKMLKNQMNSNITLVNGSIDINEIRKMVETLNNFTLEKQKLASDQLFLRINQLELDIAKYKMQNEKDTQKLHTLGVKERSVDGGYKTTDILLFLVITSLVVATLVFLYVKLKDVLNRTYVRNHLGDVRARSTNTINTTLDLPFDDRQQTII